MSSSIKLKVKIMKKRNKKFQRKSAGSLNKLSLFQKPIVDFLKVSFIYKKRACNRL